MKQLNDEKYVFLFQGVGNEYHKLLHMLDQEQLELLKHYCSIVDKELGMDLWDYLYNSTVTKFNRAFNNCIAIYVIDNIVYRKYMDLNIKPSMFLAYSMGLITALACGKAISFEAGLHTIINVYEYSQGAVRKDEAMAIVVGLTCEEVVKIINRNNLEGYVEIASENNEYCIVVSGHRSGVDEVMAMAANEGALKVLDINAPFAFHSHYTIKGINKHIEFLAKLRMDDSEVPIISVYNQNIIKASDDLKKELMQNLTSRMYWKTSIEKAASMGIHGFVEVSLGDSLTKFSKLINTNCDFFTYSKLIPLKPQIKIHNFVDSM
jgi:malonyl CoA-acyl carrier protein transacylase